MPIRCIPIARMAVTSLLLLFPCFWTGCTIKSNCKPVVGYTGKGKLKSINKNGYITTFFYHPNGRLHKTISSDGAFGFYTYTDSTVHFAKWDEYDSKVSDITYYINKNGLAEKERDGIRTNRITENIFDNYRRLKTTINSEDGLGVTTKYYYDNCGILDSIIVTRISLQSGITEVQKTLFEYKMYGTRQFTLVDSGTAFLGEKKSRAIQRTLFISADDPMDSVITYYFYETDKWGRIVKERHNNRHSQDSIFYSYYD